MSDCRRTLRLLLVEDNRGDIFLIKEMLQDTGIDLKITVAEDGQKGLDILNRANGSLDNRFDFVILDLNLPKVNGFEVLSYIKSMHGLKNIPVVILTGSLNKDDRTRAASMGAAHYLIKPSSNSEFEAIVDWMKGALDQPESTISEKCPPPARDFEERPIGPSGLNKGSLLPTGRNQSIYYERAPDLSYHFGLF